MADNSSKKENKKLLIIGPDLMKEGLLKVFSSLYTEVFFNIRPNAGKYISDPFNVKHQINTASIKPDAVLLVAPANRSPARLLTYPLIDGIPVGIVQPLSEKSLQVWLRAILNNSKTVKQVLWAILSMSKRDYLAGATKMLNGIKNSSYCNGVRVTEWFADKLYREDLCIRLAKGPNLAIYFGHARPRGWSGYRAVRWPHIVAEELERPCDVLISISCSTLKKQHQRPSFGMKWVNEGRACTYIGNVVSVKHEHNNSLAHEMMYVFQNEKVSDVGQLLQSVENSINRKPVKTEAQSAFKTYRIIGNPLQRIV